MPTQSTYRPFYPMLTLLALAALTLSIIMPSVARSAPNAALANVAATESTLVSSNDPTTNFNGSPLEVAYSNFPSFSPVRRVLVKFDLSTLTQDLSTTPFQVTVTSTSLDGTSIDVGLYALPDSWAANTVTSDTQPAVGTLLDTKTVANGFTGALRFDAVAVGTYLEGQRTGDKTASFLLRIDRGAALLFGGNMIFGTPIIDAPTTPTPTATNTTVPPTPTATNTTVPPTATATNTTVPPTPTATNTTVPPTATATNTTVPPTATATNTTVPPTATATNTTVPPTATATNTTVPPTATATNTTVPPTATATNTTVPPTATATNTSIPSTATATTTSVAPTPTATNTRATATPTVTNTPAPPTATATNTTVPTLPTVTPTSTALPATATATNTAVPTLPTVTPTSTALPPTATATNTTVPTVSTVTPTAANTPTATATPTLPAGDVVVVVDPDQEAIINWPNPDGSVINIVFPAGVVDEEITIIFNSLPAPSSVPNSFRFAGIAFTLDAYRSNTLIEDFNFRNQGIQVALTYTDAAIVGLNEDALMLYYFDEDTGAWKTDGITLVSHDKANNRIVFNVTHLTEFALFAPSGGTATPTATPTDDGDDDDGDGDDGTSEEGFDPIGGSLVGNYCLATGGIGLRANPNGAFAVNVVGTPVHAYLVWVGRYPDNSPDNDIQVSIHGGLPITVVAADDRQSELPGGVSYFTFLSMNLVNNSSFAGLLTGALNITVSGLNSGNVPGNEGYGVGLLIVSSGPTCPFSQIDLAYGLDSFFDDGTVSAAAVTTLMAPQGSLGPNSAVRCVEFPAAGASRTMNIQAFVGGVDPGQTNALWYATGAGAPPTELIANSAGMVFDGPPVTVASPFTSNLGPQLDNYTNRIVVPAGATFACFQIESAPTSDSEATDAVWISFASQLLDGGVAPTATPTPIHTPTPTATPVPTLTGVPTLPPIPTTTPTATPIPGGTNGLTINIVVEPLIPAPGDDLFFTISYTNSSAVSVENVKLTFTVPDHTTFNSTTSTSGWVCNGTGPGSQCEFSLGNVDPGESGKVRFVVTLDDNLSSAIHQIGLNIRLVDNTGAILSEKPVQIVINAPFRLFLPLSTR